MTRLEAWQSLEAIRLADTLKIGQSTVAMETWSTIEDQLSSIEALYDEVVSVQRLIGDTGVVGAQPRTPQSRTPSKLTPTSESPAPLGVSLLDQTLPCQSLAPPSQTSRTTPP